MEEFKNDVIALAILSFLLGVCITIILQPKDKSEYQFTITKDSMTVYDQGRYVGTVKVEGQLEQLLINDNE